MPRPPTPRPRRLGLTLRALWWRRGSSLTLLAVGTVTCAAAALGPMYAAAASESTLQDRLTASPVGETIMSFAETTDVSQPKAPDDAVKVAPQPGGIVGYPTSISAIQARTSVTVDGTHGRIDTKAVWRANACAHVVLVRGRCPAGPAEVMVSDRSQQDGTGIRLGSTLRFGGITTDELDQNGRTVGVPAKVDVVGLYRPRSVQDPYWAGRAYFNAHLYSGPGEGGPDTIDTVFLARSFWPTTSRPTSSEVDIDYQFDPAQVRISDEDAVRQDVHEALLRYSGDTVRLTTRVTQVLDAADHERALLRSSTQLVTLQLALLAWLVLFQVMGDAAEARGNEIALAKLRGLRPRATVAFGLGEPLAVLTIAVPLGIFVAWLLVTLIARAVLVPGVPLAVTWGAVLGALVGFAGGAVAAVLAARRVLTRPVLEQWRRVPEQHQQGAASLALDAGLVVAAIVGLVALRHGQSAGTPRPVTLVGPGLLVLTVALIGVRLLPVFGRAALAPTRGSAKVGAFLAVRQVLRRPAGLRLAALLAVAIGLATFAVDGEAVAQANRQARAAIEVGASRVVAAQYSVAHDPVAVARRVDPDGTWAMAAATWLPGGGPLSGELVAVDSSRLAAVANWPATSGSPADAAAQVRPPVAKPLVVTGTSIRLAVDGVAVTSGPWPNLVVRVHPADGKLSDLRIGVVGPGAHAYTGAVPCAAGCTLRAIVVDRPIDHLETMSGSLVVSRIEAWKGGAWTTLDAGLSTPGSWRPAGSVGASTDRLTPGPSGLRDDYSSTGGGVPAIGRADSPTPLPVVGTPGGLNRDPNAGPAVFVDNTQTSAAYTEVATVPLVPVGLDDGVLADVSNVRTQLPGFDSEAVWSVWLSPSAPADAVARLRAAGLVTDVQTSQAQRVQQLGRQGPALALLLLVACAVVGALLAAGATALAVAVTGRRRSFELAALRAVGVDRRALLRSCVGEQLILLGTGLLLGVPAGLVAARLALPVIPEFSDSTPVPLAYTPDVLVVGAFVLVVTALLVVTAVVSGRMLLRSAVPDRLREAAQ